MPQSPRRRLCPPGMAPRSGGAQARPPPLDRILVLHRRPRRRRLHLPLGQVPLPQSHHAGKHAYLDVLLPAASDRGAQERVLVNVDFRSSFEVARPTIAYHALLQRLSAVLIHKDDRLRLLVAATADAMRASLKKRSLYLPIRTRTAACGGGGAAGGRRCGREELRGQKRPRRKELVLLRSLVTARSATVFSTTTSRTGRGRRLEALRRRRGLHGRGRGTDEEAAREGGGRLASSGGVGGAGEKGEQAREGDVAACVDLDGDCGRRRAWRRAVLDLEVRRQLLLRDGEDWRSEVRRARRLDGE